MNFLETFNTYVKYAYIPIGIVLLIVVLYLLITVVKTLPTLFTALDGAKLTVTKLNKTQETTNQIKMSLDRNMPMIMGSVGALSFLRLTRKALKRRKKDRSRGIVSSVVAEYVREQNKVSRNKQIVNAAKAIGPIVTTTRNILKK